ncbi:rpsU-divergently transcribed protein [Novosphingobium barchaimii LL02]|uniref:RpsU-divergently transcribed protein n=1 Tax=Novosphingobium barchaimii LL02 TaxID=1114963 RepID=A0A0J7XSC1_9SPHN|nr:COQ9 family protein [Novosphingobium barchaimii]KMS54771.1 rpsU-divergently transcribed protein [Novosphingobium barchaimii LL02]
MTQDAATLDELRRRLAPAIADAAVFDGWTAQAVAQAAAATGTDPELAAFAFRDGAMAMITAWIDHVDWTMVGAVTPAALSNQPIRERIRRLVWTRLEAVAGREEALIRALTIMAMPQNLAASTRLGWRSADSMWRLAGDKATDYNHYTKRAILGSIYAATLHVFARDKSEDKAETAAFLDRRIQGIMRFEKAKSQLLRKPDERFSMTRLLGRMRYPAR